MKKLKNWRTGVQFRLRLLFFVPSLLPFNSCMLLLSSTGVMHTQKNKVVMFTEAGDPSRF